MDKFDDGVVTICELTDVSIPGEMAKEKLVKVSRQFFSERTISYRRQYEAKGVKEQIDMVIRTPYDKHARIGVYAVLGDGQQFVVENSTVVRDERSRRMSELTLRRLEKYYDLESE